MSDNIPKSLEERFLQTIKEKQEAIERITMNGSLPDHGKYMWYTGSFYGYKDALEIFQELIDEWKNQR